MSLTRNETLFLYVLLANLLVAMGYCVWNMLIVAAIQSKKKEEDERLKDNRRTYFIKAIVMVICPVIGVLFFALSYLFRILLLRTEVNLDDVVFSKERARSQAKADEDRERNMVPLEEAVSVNSKGDLRTVMLNVLRGNIEDSLSAISIVLDTEDSEASHYAASVLSDQLNQFRLNVQNMMLKMEQDVECGGMLLDYMDKVLRQKVFTNVEQQQFVNIMDQVAETLYVQHPAALTDKRYEGVCLRLLEIRDFENSEKWCRRLKEQHPDQLPAYTCPLKLYFAMRNKTAFFETLHALKKSDVIVDNETLELIRLFD